MMPAPEPGPRIISRSSAAIVGLIGFSAILGWVLDVAILKTFVPGFVSMKGNTAACFVLAGIALGFPRGGRARGISEAFSGIIVSIAAVTIAEYLTAANLGIDEFLFVDRASVELGLPPGRMAFATAVAFGLTGLALILVARRRSLLAAQLLTFASVLIPVFSLLAYLFGERAITIASPYTSLAVHTAISFAILGVGLLSECTETGPMAVFAAEGLGGASLRRLLPLSVASTLALGFLGFLGARAGLYSFASGMILFAVVTAVVLSLAIWVNGWLLERMEAARRLERDWLQRTLQSIGDAVIATDRDGRVQFLNPVAEKLTGWPGAEAAGLPLASVFRIINETTRAEVENPVAKVLATGNVVGLANHTLLIARDGSECPIDDSAAAIKDERGVILGVVLVFHDVKAKREAEERVLASEERYRTLFDSMDEGFCVIEMLGDPGETPADYRFLEVNPAFERHTGLRGSVGRTIRDLAPEIEGHWFEIYGDVSKTGDPVRFEFESRALEGRWFDAYAFRLGDPGGRKVAVFFKDISDRKRSEVDRVRLVEQLREADRRKDEFLAMLAHELRNPLAAISNAMGVTSRDQLPENHEWAREVITRQMRHLTRLIDDLMDVSRISRGKIELRKDVLDATAILDSAAITVGALLAERKHTLDVAIDRGNLWVEVDPTRLEQVTVNLLNNAAKYSENGGQIRLEACRDGAEVVITVRDRGIGIAPENLPAMFELFAQGDRSLARSEGGLGIGLTVVKKLIEMHGGTIEARSAGPGMGSEFAIRLPAAKPPTTPAAVGPDPARTAARKARILVVDDNLDTARGMAKLMKLIGHDVATAHDGPLALELAREFGPEIVLLDIGLPGMDGYEVALRLRREASCEDALIIAASGYGQEEDIRRSKAAGFDHHLTKPLDLDALLGLLNARAGGRG